MDGSPLSRFIKFRVRGWIGITSDPAPLHRGSGNSAKLFSDDITTAVILLTREKDVAIVQHWSYDPLILSDGLKADSLSVVLSFEGENDERVESALDQVIDEMFS